MVGMKGSSAIGATEKLFGFTFLIVRICMGLPLSAFAIYEAYHSYLAGNSHSTPIYIYFLFANLGLNGLNIYWLSGIVSKFLKK